MLRAVFLWDNPLRRWRIVSESGLVVSRSGHSVRAREAVIGIKKCAAVALPIFDDTTGQNLDSFFEVAAPAVAEYPNLFGRIRKRPEAVPSAREPQSATETRNGVILLRDPRVAVRHVDGSPSLTTIRAG